MPGINKNVAAICGSIILAGIAAGLPAAADVFRADDHDHPHMASALDDLKSARDHLTKADGFHGHRDNAVKAVDVAIEECKGALGMK